MLAWEGDTHIYMNTGKAIYEKVRQKEEIEQCVQVE